MSAKHWAGIVTGINIGDGFTKVAIRCAIQGSDKVVNAELPISEEERAAWAGQIGEKIVLSLATVEHLTEAKEETDAKT